MRLLFVCIVLVSSGCANLDRVTFNMKCKEMHGRIGNTCVLDVPASSIVEIDGDNINVKYTPWDSF